MKKVLLLLFLILSVPSMANIEQRRSQLIEVIDEELNEISRLNKQVGARNPNLLLRMAELYLEKARLIKERENYNYLTLSPEQRRSTSKKKFFSKSKKLFVNAQKTCFYILKRFPRFKNKGEVYYILAYNAREFQQPKRALQFFKKANQNARKNSQTQIKSQLLLAEMYYNQKKYSKAANLYSSALRDKNQKWWTKDAFNLAWCYFRIKKKSRAINLMKEVHSRSKSGKYVDVSDQVERDLAYFYSDSGRVKEAIAWFKKIGKNIVPSLISMGKYLKNEGKFTSAERTLDEALKYSTTDNEKAKINSELLAIYDKFGKLSSHKKVSEALVALNKRGALDPSQKEDLLYHVERQAVKLQKRVANKKIKRPLSEKRQLASYAVSYFNLLAELKPETSHVSYFLAGETYYAVKRYDSAANEYDKAYELSRKRNDGKYSKLSLDGMMAALGGRGVAKATKDKYLTKSYIAYLNKNPRGKNSFKIYQRLFSSYIAQGEVVRAEQVLLRFKKAYPGSLKKQEAMVAQIMDYFRKKKDRAGIKSWVSRINKGEFKVSKKYAQKVNQLLLTMQFENVEKLNTDGAKKGALKGYLAIYKDPGSSPEAKKNASYNIAVLFHELDDGKRAYDWAVNSLKLMRDRDVKKFEKSFQVIANNLFLQRKLGEANELYERSLVKVCKTKSKMKTTFFKNGVVISLANGNIERAQRMRVTGLSCGIRMKDIEYAELEILQSLSELRRWKLLESSLKEFSITKSEPGEVIHYYAKVADAYRENGRANIASRYDQIVMNNYNVAKKRRKKLPLEALNVVAQKELARVKSLVSRLKSIELSFPEQKFNNALKSKLGLLDKITTSTVNTFQIGSGDGVVGAYEILTDVYSYLADEIANFSPPGKSPDYVKSFKQSMGQIVNPIRAKNSEFLRQAKSQINKNDILSSGNLGLLYGSQFEAVPTYIPLNNGLIMDRGGKK
ncbi:MAG: hypothetical protein GY909_13560 [Oligoflexia bacterium]|nr:hypothetical protein [Oligoflexia bacterium]